MERAIQLMNAAPMPMVLIGPDERIIAANKLAQDIFGPSLAERHYVTVLRQPTVLDCVEAAFASDQPSTGVLLSRDNGLDTTYQLHSVRLSSSANEPVLLSLEDVSHVQEARQMRRDFVANVSHELRTPLTALLGFIETLRGPAKDDRAAQSRFLQIMEREAQRMSRLIQDLLQLGRVESEERMRPTDQVDVSSIIRSTALTLESLAVTNNIEIALTGIDTPYLIRGDSDQLSQVFTNLMENGIKYGGSKLSVAATSQDQDPTLRGPAVRITFVDDGEGIEEFHIPRLMERFYRVDSHRSRDVGGTGLGLAIVKHIVNRHRGRLRVESTVGKGSKFTVILPAD